MGAYFFLIISARFFLPSSYSLAISPVLPHPALFPARVKNMIADAIRETTSEAGSKRKNRSPWNMAA